MDNNKLPPMVFMFDSSISEKEPLHIMRQLTSESDRSVALVGASLLDTLLRNALEQSLHKDEDLTKEMFRADGPLGSFKSKIGLGKLIGLYGEELRRDLDNIRKIRNKFAHYIQIDSFDDQPIKDWLMNLQIIEKQTVDQEEYTSNEDLRKEMHTRGQWFHLVLEKNKHIKNPRYRFVATISLAVERLINCKRIIMPNPKY